MQIICTSYAAETNLPRVVMVDSSLHFHDIILRHNRAKSIRRLSRFGALHFASRIKCTRTHRQHCKYKFASYNMILLGNTLDGAYHWRSVINNFLAFRYNSHF